MTKIDFFSNAPNRLDYVVRLLQKVVGARQKAVVYGDEQALNAISDVLWQLKGFFAHDIYQPNPSATLHAPIVLTHLIADNLPHHEILVNLHDTTPVGFASFNRLIEVVPNEEEPRQAARDRWSYYKSCGYVMTHHDIAARKT